MSRFNSEYLRNIINQINKGNVKADAQNYIKVKYFSPYTISVNYLDLISIAFKVDKNLGNELNEIADKVFQPDSQFTSRWYAQQFIVAIREKKYGIFSNLLQLNIEDIKILLKKINSNDLRIVLITAIEEGLNQYIEPLLDAGADLSKVIIDPYSSRPMSAALETKNWGAVKEIVRCKKITKKEDSVDWSYDRAIFEAVAVGNTETVKFLLSQGISANILNFISNHGLLYEAIQHNQTHLIEPLVNAGAPISYSNSYYNSNEYSENKQPFHFAAARKNWKAIEELLRVEGQHQCQENFCPYENALKATIECGKTDLSLLLISKMNDTCLAKMKLDSINKAIVFKQKQLIKPLLTKGASLKSNSALFYALKNNDWEVIKTIVSARKAETEADSKNWYYGATLLQAIKSKKTAIAKLLLEQGAIPSRGCCAVALETEQFELLEPLLAAGAPIERATGFFSPLYIIFVRKEEINWTLAKQIISARKVENAAKSDLCFYGGAMLFAITNHKWDIVRLLLDQGATDGNKQFKPTGNYCLHEVILAKKPDIAFKLLQHRFYTESKNFKNQTPLGLAKSLGYSWFEEVLIAKNEEEALLGYAKWLLHFKEADHKNRQKNIIEAFEILGKLSTIENIAAESNFIIAEHLYHFALSDGYSFEDALTLAKPYFEKSTTGEDYADDQHRLYYRAMKLALDPNETEIYSSEEEEKEKKFTDQCKIDFHNTKNQYREMAAENYNVPRRLEIDKNIFSSLIKKYKLDDLQYWEKQVRFKGGTEITLENGTTIRVPHIIANLRALLLTENSLINIYALQVLQTENHIKKEQNMFSCAVTFFKRTHATRQLHEDVEKIMANAADQDFKPTLSSR